VYLELSNGHFSHVDAQKPIFVIYLLCFGNSETDERVVIPGPGDGEARQILHESINIGVK